MNAGGSKVDFKKTLPSYSARRGVFSVVSVPQLHYLAVDGRGDPNTSAAFGDAISAIYPVAYKLKFASKRELGRDYVVMPLEAQWWASDPRVFTSARDKSSWNWTLLMMVPSWVTASMFSGAVSAVGSSPSEAPAALGKVRLVTLPEGLAVQTLHVGSFDGEGETLARMHDEFIPAQRLEMVGKHHEVYFSDFRRVEPSRLRTLLRQPVRRT